MSNKLKFFWVLFLLRVKFGFSQFECNFLEVHGATFKGKRHRSGEQTKYHLAVFLGDLDNILSRPRKMGGTRYWSYWGHIYHTYYKWGCRHFTLEELKEMKRLLTFVQNYYLNLKGI